MDPEELAWLAFEARRHKRIVEVGCYMGRSTRVLAENTSGVVYAVDHWEGPKELNPQPFPCETLWPSFQANLREFIDSGEVVPIKADSLSAASKFQGKADMVFIDASHDLESVLHDLRAWAPLVERGGLLCGHDAHWAGVAEARRLLLPPHMTGVGSIWAVDNFQGLRE